MFKYIFRITLVSFLVATYVLFLGVEKSNSSNAVVCDTYQVNGGDEAFLMNLNTPLKFGDVLYDGNIYVSPKGTVTFGQGDYTYWDYPQTPSISIASYDYHAFANGYVWGGTNDLYVRYGSTSTSICVDWKVMLWGQSTGDPIYIRMIAYVDPVTYEWEPTYQVSSNAPQDARYGVRYTQGGEVFPLSIQVINEPPDPEPTIEPSPEPSVEPEPEPSVEPEPTEEPSPEPEITTEPSPAPEPTVEPIPEVTQQPVTPSNPAPAVEREETTPAPEPEKTKEPKEEVVVEEVKPEVTIEEPNVVMEEEVVGVVEDKTVSTLEEVLDQFLDEAIPLDLLLELGLEFLDLPFDQEVVLENGVVITAGIMAQLDLLNNPSELASKLFENPSLALEILKNVGSDMNKEERETAQTVVIASVIVSQIAAQAAASAASGSSSSDNSSGVQVEGSRKTKKIKKTRKYRKVRKSFRK